MNFSHVPKNVFLVIAVVLLSCPAVSLAEDWPTYQHDNRRSGATDEKLKFPLVEKWTFKSARPPQNAWEGPAKWDAYSKQSDLKSMRNFDPAFYVTVVDDKVYFGSSADDAAHCLDAATGDNAWSFYTNGPVRLPPTIFDGKAYFGSDDGNAYCVDARSGELVWQNKPSTDDKIIPSNGKLISTYPVRTGVLVRDGIAYFGASLLPWRDSHLVAVDAQTGHRDGPGLFKTTHQGMAMQGALLASDEYVYVLQGRSAPIVFNRDQGKKRGTISGEGGVYALITEDDHFIAGAPSQKVDRFKETDERGRDQMASYEGANRIVVDGGIAYLHSKRELSAFNREEYIGIQGEIFAREPELKRLDKELKELRKRSKADKDDEVVKKAMRDVAKSKKTVQEEVDGFIAKLPDCFLWRIACEYPQSLIKAGNTVIAGGTNAIAAYNAKTGDEIWSRPVEGIAHGLTVANKQLYVSTDKGYIHCFAKG
ncbi:MAG: PQQ-binding-like beta-propeller repeat protein [Candidatus Hydrogenedentota bacterium]